MSVSKEDREDYEEGLHDRQKGVFDQAINDVTVNHPDTEAYYKGRRGEQLDEDKDLAPLRPPPGGRTSIANWPNTPNAKSPYGSWIFRVLLHQKTNRTGSLH
jgi:hypothetical protein